MLSNIYLAIFPMTLLQLLLPRESGCIDNVALWKPAYQKSTLYHADRQYYSIAQRAVDGRSRVPDEPEEGCSSTEHGTDTDAWWMVNLLRLYVIVNITVSGKEDSFERLRDFYIRVGNSSNITQHAYCAYKSGWVKLRVTETFRCNSTLVGSWVSIQRTNDKGSIDQWGQGWLQLCEVQVYGYEKGTCGHRKFGLACQNICNCANNLDCDKETGECPEGACDEGYGGSTCSIKLPKLYWRHENTATPVDNTNHIRISFYQFKKGPYAYRDSGEGPVGEYSVDIKEDGSNDWASMTAFKHDDTNDILNVTVTGLKYYRQYTIRVVPWYQRGDVRLEGKAEGTITVRTDCGKPDKPVISDITAKKVIGGANVIVRFKLSEDGHNCRGYKKFDIRRRLIETPNAHWTDLDWFYFQDLRVDFFINATFMTKTHEIRVRIYNHDDKWTESDSETFTPIIESPTSIARTQYTSNTMPSTTRRSDSVPKAYTERPTKDMLATCPSVNTDLKTGIIAGSVILVVFLIIIIALLVYVWRLKQGAVKNPSTKAGTREVKSKHFTGSQDENVRANVPGMDGEYESVGLSPLKRHSYVNVEGNKYETLDKQQIRHPSPKAYAKLGRL